MLLLARLPPLNEQIETVLLNKSVSYQSSPVSQLLVLLVSLPSYAVQLGFLRCPCLLPGCRADTTAAGLCALGLALCWRSQLVSQQSLQADASLQVAADVMSALAAGIPDAIRLAAEAPCPETPASVTQDALNEIARQRSKDLFKPLRVHFIGEDGIDAGGVKKEFFQLLKTELLSPDYGMLVFQPVSWPTRKRDELRQRASGRVSHRCRGCADRSAPAAQH